MLQAYYRRGDANFALGKVKLALKDLRSVSGLATFSVVKNSYHFSVALPVCPLFSVAAVYVSSSCISHPCFYTVEQESEMQLDMGAIEHYHFSC
eukprot:567821-Pelagomonas_calceolata.AAC.1